MDESILMDTDIDEGAEFCDVGDDSFQFHAGLEVFDFADAIGEPCGAEFAAWVASRSGEFCEDIPDCEFTGIAADELCGAELCDELLTADEFCGIELESAGHFLNEWVLFGMYGGAIEWFCAATDAKESGGLLECFLTESGNFQEVAAGGEGAIFVAPGDNFSGEYGADPGDVCEQWGAGSIQIDSDGIHARFDFAIECFSEECLVDVVLILSDSDGAGIDFDEFCEGVL